jgi:hypothetical protein
MAITVTPGTKTIYVPQSYLTLLAGLGVGATEVYELDIDQLRLDLRAWEDDEIGSPEPITHRHNTEVELAGTTYARVVEFINGWIVDFEDTGTPYIVSCTGANSNITDVTDFSGGNVSVLANNAAGLIVGEGGGGGWSDLLDDNRVSGSFGEAIRKILWRASP